MKTISLLLAFLLVTNYAHAKKITIVNNTDNVIQVMMIPHGILALSKHKRAKALKNRYKQLRPHGRVKLKSDNLDGIDVKVLSKSKKSITWYKYDNIYAHSLMQEIKENQDSDMKIYFTDKGDTYEAKIGDKTMRGKISQLSKIFR